MVTYKKESYWRLGYEYFIGVKLVAYAPYKRECPLYGVTDVLDV